MSFRGIPFKELEIETDFINKKVRVICDGCGKDNFPWYRFEEASSLMLYDYKYHILTSHGEPQDWWAPSGDIIETQRGTNDNQS